MTSGKGDYENEDGSGVSVQQVEEPSTEHDWYDGFRAAIRAVREQTGGGYDADVEREAVAMRLEDALVAHGGVVTAACEPPRKSVTR